jgi:lipopolysaccharide export system protein LptA
MNLRASFLLGVLLLSFATGTAFAQAPGGPPNALQGFATNRDKPVKIDAATLEVRDKNKVATFAGNVQVVQGDTVLRCATLAVFYDQSDSGNTMKAATPGPAGQGKIRRLEAKGGVTVTQKDQTATGETGIFDMASNTVTLSGNVTVTQGQSVLRGDKLVVNLSTGEAHVQGGGKDGKGRVQALIPTAGAPGLKKDESAKGSQAHETAPATPAPGAHTPARKPLQPSGLY